ncbi:MAG: OmpA/MotB family protein [Planctomycetota bacterium]|jgi:chemotaxis protein MotB
MRVNNGKTICLLICFASVILLSGCTDWKKKYKQLEVDHKNLQGRYDFEKSQKGQLEEQITRGQQTIDELQRKIDELNQSPAKASGFGEGYDVSVDRAAGTVTVTLPNSILFSPGKASLKSATSTELNHILSVLQSQYASKQVDVVGHTDSDPIKKSKWKDNWELSAQRSLSVLRYLVQRGITPDKIRAVGRGESQPIAPNTSISGKAKNRRVEIVVYMR